MTLPICKLCNEREIMVGYCGEYICGLCFANIHKKLDEERMQQAKELLR